MYRKLYDVSGRQIKKMARKALGLALIALIAVMDRSPPARDLAGLPPRIQLLAGRTQLVPWDLPFPCYAVGQRGITVDGRGLGRQAVRLAAAPLALRGARPGRYAVQLWLFRLVPFRTIRVQVRPLVRVVPGGQAVGVLLHPGGVLVVGAAPFPSRAGLVDPALSAGVRPGDVIVAVDRHPVHSDAAVAQRVLASGGRTLRLLLRRGGREVTRPVRPAWDLAADGYRLGLFVRHSVAGVGTLTFYDPARHVYAAVGHVIASGGMRVPLGRGVLLDASINGIRPATDGRPGEKLGTFTPRKAPLGNVRRNAAVGVSGRIYRRPSHGIASALPVATPDQVRPGPAQVLTVLSGRQVRSFAIRIEQVRQAARGGRDIVFRVTDPTLVERTGGVVQGMSGSPILQDGLLVGAVTHVFVNDPSRGYGVFAYRMLSLAGLAGRSA